MSDDLKMLIILAVGFSFAWGLGAAIAKTEDRVRNYLDTRRRMG